MEPVWEEDARAPATVLPGLSTRIGFLAATRLAFECCPSREDLRDELEAELAEANAKLEAVQVLRAAGFTPAKRPGRPRKEKVGA